MARLSQEETDRLFRAITSERDRAIFRLAYHAGLRASEVGLLELRDYNPRTIYAKITNARRPRVAEELKDTWR